MILSVSASAPLVATMRPTPTAFDVTWAKRVLSEGTGIAAVGIVSGLLDKLSFRDAVIRGCAMGAVCVTAYGDYAALPDRLELERFLAGSSAHSR